MASLARFVIRVVGNRRTIWAMARMEIRKRYVGTLAGMAWSVAHPLMMILIYWVIFSLGFRVHPAGNTPFIVYFLCGLIPWTAFAETVSASSNAVTGNPYLVKKTVFPTEILPLAHWLASMVSHVIMLVILAIVIMASGLRFSFYNVQFVYFLLGMAVFSVGLGWIVAALNVFYRDVGQILAVVLNMWFWLTPVVWTEDMMLRLPQSLRFLPKLNPMYYVIHGYRASFIPDLYAPLWQNWKAGIYFWIVSLGLFSAGGLLFRRLKPDFPEVL